MKKFDYCIGNPPYQDQVIGNNTKGPSIYNLFLDSAYQIANKTEMIHPARFLFNAGDTPKKWNDKMLNDQHLKVLKYEPDTNKVFPNLPTPIKGGVAISYYDVTQDFGAIHFFTKYSELNQILQKVLGTSDFLPLSSIVFSPVAYHFTEKMHIDHPLLKNQLSKGNEYEVKTNVFDTIPEVFFDEKPDDGYSYITILGRTNNARTYKYIRKDYISNSTNLSFYKVAVPEANGSGAFGEIIYGPHVEDRNVGFTQTFISIGKFDSKREAENALKYLETKFCRAMLDTLKVTQHTSISAWKNVPIQDFTSNSDIDWSKSIHEIDLQLYKKYGLSDDEINFIETHVKEMN